jgi:hypothetical protein
MSSSLKRKARRRSAWERTKQENLDRKVTQGVVRKKELALKELKDCWLTCLESNIPGWQKRFPYFIVPNWYVRFVAKILSNVPSQKWIDHIQYLYKAKKMRKWRAMFNIWTAIYFNRIISFIVLKLPLRLRQTLITAGFFAKIYEPKPGSIGIEIRQWFRVIEQKEINLSDLK